MKWLKELKPEAKIIFVDRSNTPTMFTLSCRFESATARKAVEDELSEYLDNNFTGSLVPPYLGDDSRTPEQRAGHRLARQSFRKAREATNKAQQDPRLQPLNEQLAAAVRKEDFTEVRRLGDSTAKLSAGIAAEHRERLKKGDEGPVDPAMVDLFSEYSAKLDSTNSTSITNVEARILQRMGEIAHAADSETRIHPYSMRSGLLSSEDRTLTLTWCSFVQLPQGVPTLLNWLRKNGASDFKYDIASGEGFASDEDW
jgi:hypothetical protein